MYRYALRQERIVLKCERAAFLIPCQGLRGFDSISLLTFYLIPDPMQCHIIQSSPAVLITLISHANGQDAVGDFDTGDGGILPVGIGGEHKRHCQFLAVYDSIQLHGSIRCQVTAL